VANALAAIAAAYEVGVPPERALPALLSFEGVARRFSLRGCCSGVYLVDDYAHHPTQIRSVLDAARQRFPGAREVLVFQPHTFSRTEALFDEYATALSQADRAFVLPVYGARESGDAHALSARLAAAAGGEVLPGVEQASERLLAVLRPGDVLLNLGAGDNEQLTAELMRRMGCDGG
jgi:UDP-N-acetylmuramate--alanine ligase